MATPWATPEQLRLHLRLPTIDTDEAAAALAEAETTVRGALWQTVDAVVDDTTHLVGNGGRVLRLPEHPVTAVTEVLVDGEQLAATGYRCNRNGVLTRTDHACWPLDADVAVTYDHGWAVVPPPVAKVCVQLAGRAFVNPRDVASQTVGGVSTSYRAGVGQELSAFELDSLARYARGPR